VRRQSYDRVPIGLYFLIISSPCKLVTVIITVVVAIISVVLVVVVVIIMILLLQTDSGAHPASYPMGTADPFHGGKARPGRDADHSPPSSAEVKNE
jgi:hypothetical protein